MVSASSPNVEPTGAPSAVVDDGSPRPARPRGASCYAALLPHDKQIAICFCSK